MIEKIKRMVFHIRDFLLVLILAMFALNVENASADPVYQDAYNQDTDQEEGFLLASNEQEPERQLEQKDAKPKKMKNKTRAHSMMGFGGGGTNWMWACMIIVLMVVMMA